jgi:16S rRNA U516 pseudouridylate synthase RsuA-like enzyme
MNNTKQRKDSWLLVRLTSEQKQEIKRVATAAGCSVSDLVRKQFLTTCA